MSAPDDLSRGLLVERFKKQPQLRSETEGDDPASCAQRCRTLMQALEEYESKAKEDT